MKKTISIILGVMMLMAIMPIVIADDGGGNGDSGDGDGGPDIAPIVCGNGAIQIGEQCDDANTANGDGCSSTCQNEIHEITEIPEFTIIGAGIAGAAALGYALTRRRK